jgi:hypothetical protein
MAFAWCCAAALLGGCTEERAAAPRIVPVAVYDLTTDDTWGWHAGVKQPLGAYQDGRSIHQITQRRPGDEEVGDPDNLLWVDETTGDHRVVRHPTGEPGAERAHANPGGTLSFGPDGTIWYLTGGRAHLMPPSLFASRIPYDPRHFTAKLRAFVTQEWATSFNLHVHDEMLLLVWRNGTSQSTTTPVRFRRYDTRRDLRIPEADVDLGIGAHLPRGEPISIEQVWSRRDPRFGYVMATWQWSDGRGLRATPPGYRFGSNPFLYSADDGTTWRSVDGRPRAPLPIGYLDHDAVLVPYDHFAAGEWTSWQSWDLGVSPQGTFWTAMPVGLRVRGRQEALAMFFFDGAAWQRRDVVRGIPVGRKSHACGATKHYLVLVYADADEPNLVKARASDDDARTWSAPVVVDSLPASRVVDWISYAQPTAAYDDDTIRFFLLHHARGDREGPFRGSARWIKLGVRKGVLFP